MFVRRTGGNEAEVNRRWLYEAAGQ